RSRPFYEGLEYPELLPAYANLLVDADDNLWIQEYPDPSNDRALRWWIYSPDGALLTQVVTPPGFEAFDIGSDYILGVHHDEL
ncbi:MAG TPA: hypothetical protein VFI91_08045, partial [Longimicrobiaceae bacterium]|nr:hypothetical protein [Longimicrobiaceae bacterium]